MTDPDDRRPSLLGFAPAQFESDPDVRGPDLATGPTRDEVEAGFAREARSPLAWLRSRPTSLRLGLVLVGTLAAGILVGLSARRPDLADYPVARLTLELGLLGTILAMILGLASRPLIRPSLSPARLALALLATALVALGIALVPGPELRAHGSLGPIAPPNWASGVPCMSIGVLAAVPAYLLVRLFDRGSRTTTYLAAAAAGLVANFALTLHCPLGDVAHRVLTHASQGVILLACLGAADALERVALGRSGRAPGR